MQYLIIFSTTLALIFHLSCASPLNNRQFVNDIANAANLWAQDTSTVSQFLSSATSLSPSDLTTHANVALAAEKDELTHKVLLDSSLGSNPDVKSANDILVNEGTFQVVVNGLQNLVDNGGSMTAGDVAGVIADINTDRCNFVLPAIDQYFAAAASVANSGLLLVANRPDNCP